MIEPGTTMDAQPPRIRWRRAALLLAVLLAAGESAGAGPADAMTFIRVLGDERAEFVGVWRQPIVRENVEYSTGSGFVIAPSGLVLTSHHVIDDAPEVRRIGRHEAEVRLEKRRIEVAVGPEGALGVYEAWVVASDADLDLAVLQVTASGLPYVPFGDSDAAEAGGTVRALGFPFGRQVEVGRPGAEGVPRPTVTAGTLSAARADEAGATRYLQTSAALNPGSSGGPMVDADGYAVGVVRMKLARDPSSPGAGFAVPINLVKDFLEAQGLLGQLPAERLYPGVVHELDWKGVQVELPDGFADSSARRVVVETGDSGAAVSFGLARVATPWDLSVLEEALLDGEVWPGFAPGKVAGKGRSGVAPGRILGSALGEGSNGSPVRVDYALLDLGTEKLAARYLGPPDDLAFNLSLLRRSLETLEARPLLTAEVQAPLRAGFEPASYPGGVAGSVVLPSGWSREPAFRASCARVPAPEAGVATSPVGDFTVVLRALQWESGAILPAEIAQGCDPMAGAQDPSYGGRFERLGVPVGVWGTFVERPGEILLLEVEAPEDKLPFIRDLYLEWRERVAG
jgi:S1-C subfamily serine protease